ncbi:tRNA methyltransferase [Rhodovibrio sodomensis]|uniref:tRNA (cytidine(34)-2'-O)-methyltransferase n=1 Tax=Rhodovibrio sodomensis TaxID=1088 RepID=A0ABS1DF83_9PROT|nr:tRNA (cytidine(34)-2'-O)-methyltransferase [Rhodovibrio sodomensis]MBK1668777.1 tRNA methyltransferase [Rhodovibrio sodomensis]
MRLALYQPDIPQNTGTLLRLAACLQLGVDLIEPLGFQLDDKRLKRAGMDYVHDMDLRRHRSFDRFLAARPGRLVLLTTHAETSYVDFAFRPEDVLLLGRESAGAPPEVHARAQARIGIPLAAGMRSLNVALAAAMVAGEALRQTGGFPVAAGAPADPARPTESDPTQNEEGQSP